LKCEKYGDRLDDLKSQLQNLFDFRVTCAEISNWNELLCETRATLYCQNIILKVGLYFNIPDVIILPVTLLKTRNFIISGRTQLFSTMRQSEVINDS